MTSGAVIPSGNYPADRFNAVQRGILEEVFLKGKAYSPYADISDVEPLLRDVLLTRQQDEEGRSYVAFTPTGQLYYAAWREIHGPDPFRPVAEASAVDPIEIGLRLHTVLFGLPGPLQTLADEERLEVARMVDELIAAAIVDVVERSLKADAEVTAVTTLRARMKAEVTKLRAHYEERWIDRAVWLAAGALGSEEEA